MTFQRLDRLVVTQSAIRTIRKITIKKNNKELVFEI